MSGRQLAMFPMPKREPVRPVIKKTPTVIRFVALRSSQARCDDCVHILILAKGNAPVARLAKWKATLPDDAGTLALCAGHKYERQVVAEGEK